jgi:hypothetical protein
LMMYFMPCFTSEKIVSMLAEIKKIWNELKKPKRHKYRTWPYIKKIWMTLTFDMIFKVKGQGCCSSWYGVFTINTFKYIIFFIFFF